MKNILILAIALLAAIPAGAQYYGNGYRHNYNADRNYYDGDYSRNDPEARGFSLMPHVGVAGTTFWGDDADGSSMRAGVTAGLDVNYRFNHLISMTSGVGFTMRGADIDDNADGYVKMNHIDVPLLINFHVGRGWSLYAGVQPSFRVWSKTRFNGVENDGPAVNDYNDLNDVDVSLPIGVNYTLASGLNFGLRLTLGGVSVIDDDYYHDRPYYDHAPAGKRNYRSYYWDDGWDEWEIYNFDVSFSIGYKFHL